MAKKKHKHQAHPSHTLSVKAQSRLAKQKKRQSITRWVSIGIVGIVTAVLSVGVVTQWLIPVYIPLQKTVLTVNGTEFNARYVSRMLSWMVDYYAGGDPQYTDLLVDSAFNQIKENELMKQAAAELGITISDDDVKSQLKEAGFDDNDTNRDIVYTSLLVEKLIDDKFTGEVGDSGEQRQALVMLLESAAQAELVKERLAAGETFSDIAAELSLDSTTVTNKGDMGFHPEGILNGQLSATGLEEAVFAANKGDLAFIYDENKSKQLGYWIIKVTERKTENDVLKAQTYGILVPTIEEAEEVRAKLLAGEEFAALVTEYSQDATTNTTEKAGDLGLLSLGTSTGAYVAYAFDENIPVGEISTPILTRDSSTTGAYWLYQVAEVEADRAFSDTDTDTLINTAFSEWLQDVKEDTSNVIDAPELTTEQRTLISDQAKKT